MSNGWRQAYMELTDFIAEHSEVEIGASRVRLPDSVRPEFYRFFNAVRTSFIEENLPNSYNEATALSQNYLKAEKEATEHLGLDDVSMVASLHRFLHDPMDELKRELFDPLFDLLKAKGDIEYFEQKATRSIEASFGALYKLGYEKWVAISLVKLLEADKLFQVTPREFDSDEEKVIMRTASPEEEVPIPVESKRLSFKHEQEATLTVPDFIVHSVKVNRYIALRSQMGMAFGTASNASKKREWYTLGFIVALEPGLTLVYVDDNPEELSLIADVSKTCKPDLIIECRGQKDWLEKEGLEKIKLHHDSLKPRLGTYVVSRKPVLEQAFEELIPRQVSGERSRGEISEQELEKDVENIRILEVGFDQSKLEPIIDAFKAITNGNEQK